EPAPLQVFAEGVGLLRPRRNLAQRPGTILSRRSTDEPPLVRVEAAELVLHAQERTRVRDGGLDLQPVAHDPGVPEELRHLPRVEARDARGIEAVEGLAIRVPLSQDRDPAETRLRPLENEELEERPVVVHRDAPLLVVVADVERVGATTR